MDEEVDTVEEEKSDTDENNEVEKKSSHIKTDPFCEPRNFSRKRKNYPCKICGKILPNLYYLGLHNEENHLRALLKVLPDTPEDKEESCLGDTLPGSSGIHVNELPTTSKGTLDQTGTQSEVNFKYEVRLSDDEDDYVIEKCESSFSKEENATETSLIYETPLFDANNVKFSGWPDPNVIHRENTRHRPYIYTCKECGKSFNHIGNLKVHQRKHTGERPFSCNTCGKAFTVRSSLEVHQRLHTGEKPYVCEFCDKAFPESSRLRRHLRNHTGEKPYICSICDGAFRNCATLKAHVMTHSDVKRYACPKCNKCFYTPGVMKKHLKGHAKEPSLCRLCGKSVLFLTEHLKRHVKTKKYQCDLCNHSLANPSSLKRHQLTIHGKNPYYCSPCEVFFNSPTELKDHRATLQCIEARRAQEDLDLQN